MAPRSLQATPAGIQSAELALTRKTWGREELQKPDKADCSRQPIMKFFSGKPVSRKLFVRICQVLELDWEEVAGLSKPDSIQPGEQDQSDIDHLVKTVRAKVHRDIQVRCSTMRVLDMEQPIGLDDIYTNVNILERILGRRRLGVEELLQGCDFENFDRLGWAKVKQKRVQGLEAVEKFNKLLILGKPGAGKTTFTKRLATLCNLGEFQAHRVPIFVPLKEFAESKGEPELFQFITKQWENCRIPKAEPSVEAILSAGKALVLLDGLDEVREQDHDRVLQDIRTLSTQYQTCPFVMTCRIAAREYTFQQFTEVEVADFDESQMADFTRKWFKAKEDPVKAKSFTQKLKDNKPIQELATNPLLLTLLCLVFGETANFPANRSELYKEGLDVLLKKWDVKRNIERDQVYRKLSLQRKEDLLSQLAFQTFERSDYFFKQTVVEQKITDYIQNLPDASADPETLQLDSEAVLKSIEAQHGLLVERARGIYSFSHLTFQEYFTAKQIISSSNPEILTQSQQNLVTHIAEKRWWEVFLLTVGMLPEADYLIRLMKVQVDQILAEDEKLQDVLVWLRKKAVVMEAPYKLAAILLLPLP